ncbi:MAG: type III toxin-antitoxin system ToxN/AbiQ family toxin [Erysipelothrix sp.]
MKLYKAKKEYIDRLRAIDSKILDNKDPKIRPYWFFKIEIGDSRYAIPLSSPKEAGRIRYNPFTMMQVMKDSDSLGRLYFINMIPFDDKLFEDVSSLSDQYDQKYSMLLFNQENELNRQRDKILKTAKNVYYARYDTNHKKYEMLFNNSCDFKKCEIEMEEYLLQLRMQEIEVEIQNNIMNTVPKWTLEVFEIENIKLYDEYVNDINHSVIDIEIEFKGSIGENELTYLLSEMEFTIDNIPVSFHTVHSSQSGRIEELSLILEEKDEKLKI